MHHSLRINNFTLHTETALLRVHNDINLNIDNGIVTALALLDLSAAFDTIDHEFLSHAYQHGTGYLAQP